MSYALGFDAGERQAFEDRRNRRVPRIAPPSPAGDFLRGYWDGYTPRDPSWALRSNPPPSWWQDREVTQ